MSGPDRRSAEPNPPVSGLGYISGVVYNSTRGTKGVGPPVGRESITD